MIKSIKAILAQDKEKFKVPRKVQDLILAGWHFQGWE